VQQRHLSVWHGPQCAAAQSPVHGTAQNAQGHDLQCKARRSSHGGPHALCEFLYRLGQGAGRWRLQPAGPLYLLAPATVKACFACLGTQAKAQARAAHVPTAQVGVIRRSREAANSREDAWSQGTKRRDAGKMMHRHSQPFLLRRTCCQRICSDASRGEPCSIDVSCSVHMRGWWSWGVCMMREA